MSKLLNLAYNTNLVMNGFEYKLNSARSYEYLMVF